mmetsp:Transcript_22215/g.30941  ORF Transcript_22215/g.30941 Transcript_22215/m.30941 type:complete len:123 (+) Transcript_22215:29-397(+)
MQAQIAPHNTIAEPNSSPPQVHMQAQQAPHHAIAEPTSSPQVQMQAQQGPHHMIEKCPPKKQDRRRSSMSIGSFDCTPLDFQAKPIYEFADTMASYQAFLAGPNYETKHHVPHKKTQKACAA